VSIIFSGRSRLHSQCAARIEPSGAATSLRGERDGAVVGPARETAAVSGSGGVASGGERFADEGDGGFEVAGDDPRLGAERWPRPAHGCRQPARHRACAPLRCLASCRSRRGGCLHAVMPTIDTVSCIDDGSIATLALRRRSVSPRSSEAHASAPAFAAKPRWNGPPQGLSWTALAPLRRSTSGQKPSYPKNGSISVNADAAIQVPISAQLSRRRGTFPRPVAIDTALRTGAPNQ
jgi:hypothetical protein